MAYTDSTGVKRKYGTEKTSPTRAGEYVTVGALREVEARIELADLTEAEVVVSDVQVIPRGALIEEVELVTIVAAATGVAIDVGLIRLDQTTEIDYNGLIAAEVTADMSVAGEKHVYRQEATVGAGAGGALIGTTLANPGFITASRTTATAFTAGEVYIRVRYTVPNYV
jgi:hypothetical protein